MKKGIKFGPAGLGGVNEAIENLQEYYNLGLRACEIAFTYGIYIKNEKDAKKIRDRAKQLGIELSIHAPYYINLNSKNKEIIEKSKKRILDCCKIGTYLGVRKIVFHPGYYAGMDKKETYENIKNVILEIQEERRKNKWAPKLAPETTGKINVFGSIEEIAQLVEDTGCSFCIDFAHILAREKTYQFKKVKNFFRKHKEWHIHFSGIEYGEKGEKKHKETESKEWKRLLKELPENKDIVIINESPNPIKDSIDGLQILKNH